MTIYRRSDPIPSDAGGVTKPGIGANFRRGSLDREAARAIYEAIMRGSYPEGTVIPTEDDLVGELGISRTAVREAVKGLVSKGLLQTRRRAGTLVRDRSHWNLMDADIMEWSRGHLSPSIIAAEFSTILDAVEPAAAALAAQSRQPGLLEALHEIIAGLATDWADPSLRVVAIATLHEAIARASGNRYLLFIANAIYADLLRHDSSFLLRRSEGRLRAYSGLVEAIGAFDAHHAPGFMREIIAEPRIAAQP